MLIWNAGTQQATALDYREVAPSAATQDMFVGPHDGESPSLRGGKAVAVPGTVAGLCYAARHYGTLPLNQLLAPALRLADSGVPRDSHDQLILQHVQQTLRTHNEYAERFEPLLSLYLSPQKGLQLSVELGLLLGFVGVANVRHHRTEQIFSQKTRFIYS